MIRKSRQSRNASSRNLHMYIRFLRVAKATTAPVNRNVRIYAVKCFPHYWPFVRAIHRLPMDSIHEGIESTGSRWIALTKGQWFGTFVDFFYFLSWHLQIEWRVTKFHTLIYFERFVSDCWSSIDIEIWAMRKSSQQCYTTIKLVR